MNNIEIEQRFQRRNIANCLSTIFPPDFTVEEHSASAHEILRLMALLNDDFKTVFNEFEFLIIKAKQYCLSESSELKHVLNKIKKNKTLKTHYVPAFICCELQMVSYNQEQFEQYKALTLIVCVRLMMMGEHDSAVKNVCNEIRLYSDGRRTDLVPWLPNINTHQLHELISKLDMLRQQASDNSETLTVSSQLSHFYVSYHDSYQVNKGITRNVTSREFTKAGVIRHSSPLHLDDDIDATVTELREVISAEESWQAEENNSGNVKTLNMVTIAGSGEKNYASQVIQAKAVENRALKKKLSLTCDPYLPTVFEIRTLILECITALTTDDKSTVQLILLMLFFGNTAEQVRQLKPAKQDGKITGIIRKHILPTQKYRKELSPLLKQVSSSFTLPIPVSLYAGVKSLKFENVNDKQISSFIQKVNKKHTSNITLTKISTSLTHKMIQESIDPVFTELIKGGQVNSLAALSYTHLKLSELLCVYKRYIKYLNAISPKPNNLDIFQLTHNNTEEDLLLGSPLAIDLKVLRELFAAMDVRLTNSFKKGSRFDEIEYHNLVTIHVQTILALSSGYRPVIDWLGDISDINLVTGHYWISDKESIRGNPGRQVVIPELTLKILKQYLHFLGLRATYYRNTDPELSLRYQNATNANDALFFYRHEHHLCNSSPKTIAPLMDAIFPLPLNWHRHHIRTYLHNNNIHPELIAAWMGHADIGQSSFTQYSNLDINDLDIIAQTINQHLHDIGIKVISYAK